MYRRTPIGYGSTYYTQEMSTESTQEAANQVSVINNLNIYGSWKQKKSFVKLNLFWSIWLCDTAAQANEANSIFSIYTHVPCVKQSRLLFLSRVHSLFKLPPLLVLSQ